MLKFIVALVIAAVAGLIGYLFMFQTCGGVVLRSAEDCRAQRIEGAFCDAFASRLRELARQSASSYPNEADCRDRYAVCMARENPRGWSPVPSAACVAHDSDGRVARVEPVYERAGARRLD